MLAESQTLAPDNVYTVAARNAARAVERAAQEARGEFTDAVGRWRDAVAVHEAIPSNDPDDQEDDAGEAVDRALSELMHLRAPDLTTIAAKGRIFAEELLGSRCRSDEANADNPAYLSHLLSQCTWAEQGMISLFQDAAMLCGASPEIGAARADGFKAHVWLAEIATETGAALHWIYSGDRTPDRLSVTGAGHVEAQAAFDALPEWHQDLIRTHLQRQAARAHSGAAPSMPAWVAPIGTAHMIRVFAEMAAYEAERNDPVQRALVRNRLRESMRRDIGLPVGVPDFDADDFIVTAYFLDCRFRIQNAAFGPEILRRNGDASPGGRSMTDLFCQLDSAQIEELLVQLAVHKDWAERWIAQVEADSGCIVSCYGEGIGFGLAPDNPAGRLEVAVAALNELTPDRRSVLKAYGQSSQDANDSPTRMAS